MSRRVVFLVAVALGLSACAGAGTGGSTTLGSAPSLPEMYQHRVSTNDVEVYWNCATPDAGTVGMDGVVRNSKGGVVGFMELELVAADARGRSVASAKTALREIRLFANQLSPFALRVSAGGAERFDLYYTYNRDAAQGEAQQARYQARDVCSPTQHRVKQQG